MQNRYLDERTARDIDKRITKILNDLDNPEPPLRLEQVRELLKLDFGFYSSSDTGAIAETIHRLKVAGKQVISRPSLLIDAIKKWELKALWVPDRKRILLDSELPPSKQRWGEAHEIGHSVLPWHVFGAALHDRDLWRRRGLAAVFGYFRTSSDIRRYWCRKGRVFDNFGIPELNELLDLRSSGHLWDDPISKDLERAFTRALTSNPGLAERLSNSLNGADEAVLSGALDDLAR